ncbi:hypothetical protein L341_2547 [Escherichia coli CE418]|nr:hypothetical protein EC2848050_5172 [Escherichia coli 2848050]EST00215.1 hypothetical protein L341_2547 [Escherichia coli CE418]KDY90831.1 hypothetical protein AB64_3229 [Escherichia coli 2-427-07_S1_C3]
MPHIHKPLSWPRPVLEPRTHLHMLGLSLAGNQKHALQNCSTPYY